MTARTFAAVDDAGILHTWRYPTADDDRAERLCDGVQATDPGEGKGVWCLECRRKVREG